MKSIIQTASLSLIESVTVVLNEAKLLTASITPNLIWNASLDFFSNGEPGVPLKAHRQISGKRCFEKYCSCDQACQFSAS